MWSLVSLELAVFEKVLISSSTHRGRPKLVPHSLPLSRDQNLTQGRQDIKEGVKDHRWGVNVRATAVQQPRGTPARPPASCPPAQVGGGVLALQAELE